MDVLKLAVLVLEEGRGDALPGGLQVSGRDAVHRWTRPQRLGATFCGNVLCCPQKPTSSNPGSYGIIGPRGKPFYQITHDGFFLLLISNVHWSNSRWVLALYRLRLVTRGILPNIYKHQQKGTTAHEHYFNPQTSPTKTPLLSVGSTQSF